MKIISHDKKTGIVQLLLQNLTDLWHLSHVVEAGDLVQAKTYRRVALKRDSAVDFGERKPVILTVKTESSEFDKNSGRLRVSGMIVEGPEDFSKGHHSIVLEPGITVSIKKEWQRAQLERLKRAKINQPLVLVCLIDRERANFVSLAESGLDALGGVDSKRVSKSLEIRGIRKDDVEGSFYEEVCKYLLSAKGYEKLVLAGPGFEKENILKYIKAHYPELTGRIITESVGSTTATGVNELLKKSSDRILMQTRIVRETRLVEELLVGIKNEGLVAYGKEHVKKVVEAGAAGRLIVSEEKINELEALMEQVEQAGGEVFVIGKDHEAGERLLAIGGVGAFLRYKISN